jgi:hypothetical protein
MPLEIHDPSRVSIPPQDVHSELELLLQSPLFSRSEKLRRFLRFVCEVTVQGNASQINEHLIGIEVFKRGSDYNPGEDAVVRRHAHALRQKLQEYYATEGADHAIRVEMPVGRYVPVFRRREELPPEVPLPAKAPKAGRRRWLLSSLAAIAVFAVGWSAARMNLPPEGNITAPTRELWSAWIGKDTILSFSNPTAAVARQLVDPVPSDILTHSLLTTPREESALRAKFGLPIVGRIYLEPTIAQTMMGEAIAATQLAGLFARTGTPLRTLENRFLSWENLRRENHVLLGGDAENHWVDAILESCPFQIKNPADGSARKIVNTSPTAGELANYRVVGTEETREEYALVSMIQGLTTAHEFLVICGLNSPASPLATEYLTTDSGMQQLIKALRKAAPRHSGTWHFQAIIKVDLRDKVPTGAAIAALRVL